MAKPGSLRARLMAGATSALVFIQRQSIRFGAFSGPQLKRFGNFAGRQFKRIFAKKSPREGPSPINVQPWKYWGWLGLEFVVAPFLLHAFREPFHSFTFAGHTVWNTYLLMGIIEMDFWSCWRKVPTDYFGGISVFENEAIELKRGWYPVPAVMKLHLAPRNVQQDQFPSDPEKVLTKPAYRRLESGMFEPMEIATGGPVANDDDILNVRGIFTPLVSVEWQVELKGFFEFYINTPGTTWPAKQAYVLRKMRDAIQGRLGDEFRKYPAHLVIKNLPKIRKKLQEALAEETCTWGISICKVEIQNVVPDKVTQKALDSIAQARATGQATITTAGATKEASILEAQGRAEGRKVEAVANQEWIAAEGRGQQEAATAQHMTAKELATFGVAKSLGEKTVVLGSETLLDPLKRFLPVDSVKPGEVKESA